MGWTSGEIGKEVQQKIMGLVVVRHPSCRSAHLLGDAVRFLLLLGQISMGEPLVL